MKKYKIVKFNDRYYRTYKAVLYKQIKVWALTLWIEWEVTKGKEWWVQAIISEWQHKFDIDGYEDRSKSE